MQVVEMRAVIHSVTLLGEPDALDGSATRYVDLQTYRIISRA
jgi:hypothetical protein